MKRICSALLILLFVSSLASCHLKDTAQKGEVSSAGQTDKGITTTTNHTTPMGGSSLAYSNYKIVYGGFNNDFTPYLIAAKGQSYYDTWCQENAALFPTKGERSTNNLAEWKAITDYNISRQKFYDLTVNEDTEYAYTKAMADAVYDHDTVAIKRLFVDSQIAFFNEQDKEIYGLRELTDLTLEQAKAAGIQKESVRALLAQWDAVSENNEETDGKRNVAGVMVDFAHIRSLYNQL